MVMQNTVYTVDYTVYIVEFEIVNDMSNDVRVLEIALQYYYFFVEWPRELHAILLDYPSRVCVIPLVMTVIPPV
jgi:hypothetical protein